MNREFIYLNYFLKKWKELKLSEEELHYLENYLLENPEAGDVMRETGGLRKMRWAIKNKGKSGSVRILYIDIVFKEKIYFIDLFTKSEKENLSDGEKKAIRRVIQMITDEEMKR